MPTHSPSRCLRIGRSLSWRPKIGRPHCQSLRIGRPLPAGSARRPRAETHSSSPAAIHGRFRFLPPPLPAPPRTAPRRGRAPQPRPLCVATPLSGAPAPRAPPCAEGAGPRAGAPLAVGGGKSRASGDPEATAGRVGGRREGGGGESLWPQVAAAPAATAATSTSAAPSTGAWQRLGPPPRQDRCLRRRLRAGFAAVAPRQRSRRAGL